MREVLDRLKMHLMTRLPEVGGVPVRIELTELAAVAAAVRDYAEAELIYRQANPGVIDGSAQETA